MLIRVSPLAPGEAGSQDVLGQMVQWIRQADGDPLTAAVVRRILPLPQQDRDAAAETLRQYLAASWQFVTDDLLASGYDVRDPEDDVEVLHTPHELAQQLLSDGFARGDCDDAAIIGAALGRALGFPVRLVALGFAGEFGPLTHVYAEVWTGRRWVDLDVTKPSQGVLPAVTRTEVVSV